MQNKGKLTIMKYFRACVGSFLVYYIVSPAAIAMENTGTFWPYQRVIHVQVLYRYFMPVLILSKLLPNRQYK